MSQAERDRRAAHVGSRIKVASEGIEMANDDVCVGGGEKAPWTRRLGGASVWGVIFLSAVVVSWTMLKGAYYKMATSEPPASAVGWRTDFAAALAESASSGAPLLLDFGAAWCPPCRVMEHEVWPDGEVGAAVEGRFIPVRLDVDDPKAGALAGRYGVEGIPAIFVVDGSGRVLRRAAGFMAKEEVIAFLDGREGGPAGGE